MKNLEVLKSVLRSVLQILGILIALNVKIPFIGEISQLFTYVLGQADTIVQLVQGLIGIALTMYGFFFDKARFEDRSIGKMQRLNKKK